MTKRSLLLLFGGESPEHEVSVRSAVNVYEALNKDTYAISLGYIDRDGKWWRVDSVAEPTNPSVRLEPLLGEGCFRTTEGEVIEIDVILPVVHGINGEDGSVQGLAQLLHIPIVGCDVLSSAVCMDKDVSKRLLGQAGVPVVDYISLLAGDAYPDFDEVTKQLGGVLFVKPANTGSSVGVSKVTDAKALADAISVAFRYDRKVLIERAAIGRELECAVLGNDHPEVSVVGEVMPGDDFYTYDAKFAPDSSSTTSTEVDLPSEVTGNIRRLAITAYQALGCRGMARVDFFLTEDGRLYVNELNTLPGFTSISLYPQLWMASGLSYSALLDRLVDLALE